MCLRDKAVGWFEDLIENGINVDDWDIVKGEFLETYEPKYSTKTACANFTDLNQKSDETINDYTYRVQQAYKRVTDKMQDILGGLFTRTELSEVLTEIVKMDPNFCKEQFLKDCERDIIPNVLEAMIRGDLDILQDW